MIRASLVGALLLGQFAAAHAQNRPVILVPVADGGHGFGGREVNARVDAFLDKRLLGKEVAVSSEPIQP